MKRLAIVATMLLLVFAGGAVLFAWSGLYNVAASAKHFWITRVFLEFAMRSSVRTWSAGIEPPPLDDIALVQRGAGHYHDGCKPCHGAPGEARSPVVRRMLPPPPFLPHAVDDWERHELFWIVKHGLKYTGMPAWTSQHRDDEVWAMVAFLLRLPGMGAEDYRRLALGDAEPEAQASRLDPALAAAMKVCVRCHGLDGAGRGTGAFPRLAGQNEGYLYQSLRAYAEGLRGSGIMEPVAARLSGPEMQALARYYAAIENAPPPAPALAPDNASLARGRTLAEQGAPETGVPACAPCHGLAGPPANRLYPALAGQHRNYLATQLRLYNTGKRGGAPTAHVMSKAAWRLTNDQILDISEFYSSLRPERPALGR